MNLNMLIMGVIDKFIYPLFCSRADHECPSTEKKTKRIHKHTKTTKKISDGLKKNIIPLEATLILI
jgi:hypothetical protein